MPLPFPPDPPPPVPPTPGWKTTEFWLTLGTVIVAALLNSGIFPGDSMHFKFLQMISMILAGLSTSGYAISRGMVKASENKMNADVAKQKIESNTRLAMMEMTPLENRGTPPTPPPSSP